MSVASSKSAERNRFLEYINLLGYVLFVVVNLLANIVQFNGTTTGAVSDAYPNLFAPAGLTFSIWGVIYVALGFFVYYQFRGYAPNLVSRIGYWFLLSNIANVVWLFLWHYYYIPITLLFMIILFLSLMMIYLSLGQTTNYSKEDLVMRVPFSIYLGWITVATIANVTTVLVYFQWDALGIPQSIWAIIVIVVAIIITWTILFTRGDIAYSAVIMWALLGIMIKRLSDELAVAAIAAIGIMAIFIGILLVRVTSPEKKVKRQRSK